ncbi:MAG: nitronate monooxygenase [Gammaproteobacteria bacterium]|nr:nitronate monooxygenase [Gammaproteobacteria bacterium]
MLRVSGLELVSAACAAGVIGAFPTANCRDHTELGAWLDQLDAAAAAARAAGRAHAPYCPNLIMRRDAATLDADVAAITRHACELVITSVGSPRAVVPALHRAGCQVYADVATLRHVDKALADGVDGLVLLTAGAGGQTGWLNPFAFVRAVRARWDGPVVLAGGIGDGVALRAAIALGCDLGYMGTGFIATAESLASDAYKRMLVDSSIDDIVLTSAFTGLPTSFLAPSIAAAGIDLASLPERPAPATARARFGPAGSSGTRRWADVWSAGHSVAAVSDLATVADRVRRLRAEYEQATG